MNTTIPSESALPSCVHPLDQKWVDEMLEPMPVRWRMRALKLYVEAYDAAYRDAEGQDFQRASRARAAANLRLLDLNEIAVEHRRHYES